MIIAVDFDGTIVQHDYPRIGRERPFAIATLKRLKAEGHILILWTYREGELLDEAVQWCRDQGLEFHAINSNDPLATNPHGPRKLNAEIYIDDRNIGGLPDWGAIYQMIQNRWTYPDYISRRQQLPPHEKPSIWRRLLGL